MDSPPPSPSPSYIHKTVTLLDWWLTKPQTHHHPLTLGVAGLTSQQNHPVRCFSSAPILKVFDLFELETVDGVSIILQGFINKHQTLLHGFSPNVFDHFLIGFPANWKEFCPTIESAAESVTTDCRMFQEEDGKDSVEGHDFRGKPQNCDSNTVDMGVEDCKGTMLSNKDSTPLNQSSDEIPHEHMIEAGNEELCGKSSVTPESKDDPSFKMSPIVSNTMDSSTRSKCLRVSSRCMTRSVKAMDCPLVNDTSSLDNTDPGIRGSCEILNKNAVNVVDCDMKSKRRKIDSKSSGGSGKWSNKTASCYKSVNQSVCGDADVSGESQIDTTISDLDEKDIAPKCSVPVSKTSMAVKDVNEDIDLVRTNMKRCRNKKNNRVDISEKKRVAATNGTRSKEAATARNRSETKLLVKRKLITSPKSAKSTPIRGKKGSEEQNGSANILSIESFSGRKSRSGRVILPQLEFWRNQKVVYDEDGEVCGVQEPK